MDKIVDQFLTEFSINLGHFSETGTYELEN